MKDLKLRQPEAGDFLAPKCNFRECEASRGELVDLHVMSNV